MIAISQMNHKAETRIIGCAEAGCAGCKWTHRVLTGVNEYTVNGKQVTQEEWDIACQLYEEQRRWAC